MLMRLMQDYQALVDGIGIFLCLLILCYLVRNRLKSGRKATRPGRVPDFGDQVIQCMVSEHIDRVVKTVMAKVGEELQSLPANSPAGSFDVDRRPQPNDVQQAGSIYRSTDRRSARSTGRRTDRSVTAVCSLLEKGMGIAEISRSTQRPVAEIELCAWLARRRKKSRFDSKTGDGRQ